MIIDNKLEVSLDMCLNRAIIDLKEMAVSNSSGSNANKMIAMKNILKNHFELFAEKAVDMQIRVCEASVDSTQPSSKRRVLNSYRVIQEDLPF